ncbi:MAG: SMP-30/gluconolactonase/LRE family protein [Verrucomicrobia bacterium]|nr:SMP-30/gluconolactonase/LRE family protein [Verrucomicrobiota bacterium]
MRTLLRSIGKSLALGCCAGYAWPIAGGPIPAAPKELLVSPGDKQIAVSWQAVPGARSYIVKRGGPATASFTNLAAGLTQTSFTDTNVINGRTTFYMVAAENAAGESATSPALSAVPSAAVLDVLPAGAKVERLATGFGFVEGPVWISRDGGFLVFSDINNNRLNQWKPGFGASIFRQRSNQANGNTLDQQGRLITCEHAGRRVSRTEADGTIITLADRYDGRTLNAPNDIAVKSDGTFWFTDPNYGLGQTQRGRYVFRFDPAVGNASLFTVATNFDQPNGICFSPDEKRLYIADSGGPHHVRVFDVLPNNTLANGRVFAVINPGAPDGMRTDSQGRLFSSAGDGVQVFGTNGVLLGKILTRETAANVCFGGPKNEMMFITAQTSLYGITRMPDLIVTAISRAPANPAAGQAVRFSATVKNQGTGPTLAGTPIRVAFTIGSTTNVVWSDGFDTALPPDASVVLTCNAGVAGATWVALAGGHAVRAVVDDLDRFAESLETNNSFSRPLDVPAAAADSDGDGLDDPSEAIAGTDPQDAASVLRIVSSRLTPLRGLALSWTTVAGRKYRVVCKGSLTDFEWLDLSEVISATGSSASWTNGPIGDLGPMLYRVRVEP